MQYFPPDTYLGGTADQVVATDAKDGTPIDHSLVRETGDGVNSELHVFCTYYPHRCLARPTDLVRRYQHEQHSEAALEKQKQPDMGRRASQRHEL